ncbi:MAG TPA: FGGY family carbohydrate kinase [Chitinophagaceae bacterium]|nr:FGGY family carbohydrate kinase [Chitinophagaceae bacterium]
MPVPVIAIFDIGKTNKKLLLFDEQYTVVYEKTIRLAETTDADGFPCEDVTQLRNYIFNALQQAAQEPAYEIKAINIAAYGASLVCVDAAGIPVLPLYNYLKPYPQSLQEKLYSHWGGADDFARTTASPQLGSLNSGLQLYRIKEENPEWFEQMKWALHLPQYISYLLTNEAYSDLTSIGCHTALWDFEKQGYHAWVGGEGIAPKLAPIASGNNVHLNKIGTLTCAIGIGLHDSSAALIPYRESLQNPFVLLSTGTWCISLNPFATTALTATELAQDCLCYLDYKGASVKAARLFLGPQYEAGLARLCKHFQIPMDAFLQVSFNAALLNKLKTKPTALLFADEDLGLFEKAEEGYHQLMLTLLKQQVASTNLVLQPGTVKTIYVDGGFAKNEVFMYILAAHYTGYNVYAASMPQGTALGAALAIHHAWNKQPVPVNLIQLKKYTPAMDLGID